MILDYTMILDYCGHFGDSERSDTGFFRRSFPWIRLRVFRLDYMILLVSFD